MKWLILLGLVGSTLAVNRFQAGFAFPEGWNATSYDCEIPSADAPEMYCCECIGDGSYVDLADCDDRCVWKECKMPGGQLIGAKTGNKAKFPVCEVNYKNNSGSGPKVTRQCKPITSCMNAALWGEDQACNKDKAAENAATHCRTCTPPVCGNPDDPCQGDPDPCGPHKESCTNDNGQAVCVCEDGWLNGVTVPCSDPDPCADNYCKNGGTCSRETDANGGIEAKCKCPTGFEGETCDEHDPCDGETCSGNGGCSNMNGQKMCTCELGYTGDDCENYDDCEVNDPGCGTHGHCDSDGAPGDAECDCDDPWTGDNCDENPCVPDPCDQGICEADGTCTCDSGWTGDTCDENPCVPDPCDHGTCNADGSCTCDNGYTGPTCDEAKPNGLCGCYGDPHCYMFDGEKHLDELFIKARSCWYTLSQDQCVEGDATYRHPNFIVAANLRIPKPNMRRSYVEEVKISYKEEYIILSQFTITTHALLDWGPEYRDAPWSQGYFDVQLVDPATLPPEQKLFVNNPSQVIVVDIPNVRVLWDMEKEVKIVAHPSLMGDLCGICGNFDDDNSNDMVLGNHLNFRAKPCEAMEAQGHVGKPTTNEFDFISSWLRFMDENEYECFHECKAP